MAGGHDDDDDVLNGRDPFLRRLYCQILSLCRRNCHRQTVVGLDRYFLLAGRRVLLLARR